MKDVRFVLINPEEIHAAEGEEIHLKCVGVYWNDGHELVMEFVVMK